jgi:hypothetical protein
MFEKINLDRRTQPPPPTLPYQDLNCDPSVVQHVASRYTDWAIPALYNAAIETGWFLAGISEIFKIIFI